MSDGKWEIKVDNINADAIFNAAITGMVHGMNTWLEIVADQARQKAPIRRVFKDQMKSRRTAWRTVFMGEGSAESVMANYRLMYSGMTPNENRNVRTKTIRGKTAVQVRSWRVQGPTEPAHQAWKIGSSLHMLGRDTGGLAYESELTSRARWAYVQALKQWREPGQNDWRYSAEDEERAQRLNDRRKVKPVAGGIRETALTTVMKGDNGEANAESRMQALGSYASKSAVVQMGGTLRKSIHAERARVDGGTIRGKVIAEVRYAKYVEFGTATRGRAQPFLRPALHQNRRQLARSVASDVRHTVIRGGKA